MPSTTYNFHPQAPIYTASIDPHHRSTCSDDDDDDEEIASQIHDPQSPINDPQSKNHKHHSSRPTATSSQKCSFDLYLCWCVRAWVWVCLIFDWFCGVTVWVCLIFGWFCGVSVLWWWWWLAVLSCGDVVVVLGLCGWWWGLSVVEILSWKERVRGRENVRGEKKKLK